jgi:hypothetical protein
LPNFLWRQYILHALTSIDHQKIVAGTVHFSKRELHSRSLTGCLSAGWTFVVVTGTLDE